MWIGLDRLHGAYYRHVLRKVLEEHFRIMQQAIPLRALRRIVLSVPILPNNFGCLCGRTWHSRLLHFLRNINAAVPSQIHLDFQNLTNNET